MNAQTMFSDWKSYYKKVIITAGYLLYICLVVAGSVKSAGAGVQFQRELRIVAVPIMVSPDAPKEQHSLAEILGDILVQELTKTLWRETRGQIQIERMMPVPRGIDNESKRTIKHLSEEGFTHLISGELKASPLGYALRTKITDIKMALGDSPNSSSSSLSAIMGGNANYDEIEAKIADLALGLTRVLATGKTDKKEKRVFFWCVSPVDPDNPTLATVSRRIALELPYYLTQLWEKESPHNHLASLNPRDYYYFCGKLITGKGKQEEKGTTALEYMEFDRYDYIITALVEPAGKDTIDINFLIVERRASNYINIPMPTMSFPANFTLDTLAKFAHEFSDAFENAISTR